MCLISSSLARAIARLGRRPSDGDVGERMSSTVRVTYEFIYDADEPTVIEHRLDAQCPWCLQGQPIRARCTQH